MVKRTCILLIIISWGFGSYGESMNNSLDQSAMIIPSHLIAKVLKVSPHSGQKWIDSIPCLIEHLISIWNVENLSVVDEDFSTNLVIKGFQKTIPIVVKLIFDSKEYINQKNSMVFYRGKGMVSLINFNDAHQALLMECVEPGFPLSSDPMGISDVNIASALMKKLHECPIQDDHQFKDLTSIISRLENVNHDFYPHHINKAQILSHDLMHSQNHQVLLHGSLHHFNILSSHHHGWIAIDPNGCVGDPAFEPGAFIRNPITGYHAYPNDLKPMLVNRINGFAFNLNLSKERIMKWAYVQAVIGGVMFYKVGKDPKPYMHRADILLQIINENS
jgi:streptomycin 6-kinase